MIDGCLMTMFFFSTPESDDILEVRGEDILAIELSEA